MTADDEIDPFDLEVDDSREDEPHESPVAGPHDPLFGGLDVTAVAAQLIAPAVQNAIGKRVDRVAAKAVDAVLTDEILGQLQADAAEAAESALTGSTEEADPVLYYGSTDEFVREYLRYVYQRKIDGRTACWSPRWWTSAEAVARLEALWRAWEHLRLDPATGPSVWWRDHADPHMRVLMDSTGPFSKETEIRATVQEPLPYEEPPEGLFPDVRENNP